MADNFPASYWTWSSSASICPFFGRLSALAIRLLRASGPLTAPPAAPSLLAFFSRKPGLTTGGGGACAAAAGATGAAAAAVSGSGPAPPAAADDGGAADELAAGGTVDAGRFEFCVAARASPASVSQHTGQIKTRTGMREAWHRASTVARMPGRSRDAPWRALRNLCLQAPGRSSASRFSSAPIPFQAGERTGRAMHGKGKLRQAPWVHRHRTRTRSTNLPRAGACHPRRHHQTWSMCGFASPAAPPASPATPDYTSLQLRVTRLSVKY